MTIPTIDPFAGARSISRGRVNFEREDKEARFEKMLETITTGMRALQVEMGALAERIITHESATAREIAALKEVHRSEIQAIKESCGRDHSSLTARIEQLSKEIQALSRENAERNAAAFRAHSAFEQSMRGIR